MRDVWMYVAGPVPGPIRIRLNFPLRKAPDCSLGNSLRMSPPGPSYARCDRIFRDVWRIQDPLGQQMRITKLMD